MSGGESGAVRGKGRQGGCKCGSHSMGQLPHAMAHVNIDALNLDSPPLRCQGLEPTSKISEPDPNAEGPSVGAAIKIPALNINADSVSKAFINLVESVGTE